MPLTFIIGSKNEERNEERKIKKERKRKKERKKSKKGKKEKKGIMIYGSNVNQLIEREGKSHPSNPS